MQATIDENKQYRSTTQRELKLNQETLQQRQTRIHELEDELRTLRAQLEDEKVQHAVTRSDNERLKSLIEALESKLRTLKLQNVKEENEHNATLDDLSMKMNEMEILCETTSTKKLELENRIKAMERRHREEMNNMREQMQSLQDLNDTLKEENQTAVDVMDGHRLRVKRQKERVSSMQFEKDVIARQLEQLQSHYSKVVDQQIEDDHKFAMELQRKEEEAARRAQERAMKRKKRKSKKGKGKNGKNLKDQGDSEDDEPLLMGHGVTPGMPDGDSMSIVSMDDDSGDSDSDRPPEPLMEVKEDSDRQSDRAPDSTDSESDDVFDQEEQWSQVIKHKRTQSGRMGQHGMTDSQHMTSQFTNYTAENQYGGAELESFDHVDTDKEYALRMQQDQMRKHEQSWNEQSANQKAMDEKERLRRKREERERYLANCVSVNNLENDDVWTPKGTKYTKKDALKVKPMKDRLSMDVKPQLDQIQKEESDMLIADIDD